MNTASHESAPTILPATAEELLPLVYGELRRLAASHMANHRLKHVLEWTESIDENN